MNEKKSFFFNDLLEIQFLHTKTAKEKWLTGCEWMDVGTTTADCVTVDCCDDDDAVDDGAVGGANDVAVTKLGENIIGFGL